MSWWGKKGLLFALFFWLVGCDSSDSSSIALQRRGSDLLNIEYKEFSVASGIFISDSVNTSYSTSLQSGNRLMVGRYADDVFGPVTAQFYTEFKPYVISATMASDAALVSASLVLGFDYYYYGSSTSSTNGITVYELESPLSSAKRYTANSSAPVKNTPIGSASYVVDPTNFDSKLSSISNPSTTLTRKETDSVVVALSNEFASRLFEAAKQKTYKNFTGFNASFPGIAVMPDKTNDKVVGFNMDYSTNTTSFAKSRIILTYDETNSDGKKVEKTLEYGLYNVGEAMIGFTGLQVDRTGTALQEVTQSYIEFNPVGMRYYQSGKAMLVLVDFSQFLATIDAIENIIFNSVELSIDIEDPGNFPPPTALHLNFLDPSNQFVSAYSSLGVQYVQTYKASLVSLDEINWLQIGSTQANAENAPSTLRLLYDKDKKNYHGDFTILFQILRYVDDKKLRPKRFALAAQKPWGGLSVNRFTFKPESIKLKVHYTTPMSTKTP